ncbi:MAG: aldolase, partial [Candidatus Bathyarchaeia archaeon]
KTTHTYGLLRLNKIRVISDDWFFVRMEGEQIIAFASEKNFYIQADIAKNWGEYQKLLEKAEFDSKGRAIVNVRWVVGKGKILPMTTLKKTIVLKRDPEDKLISSKISSEEVSRYLENVDFCNPHMLVKDERKTSLRKNFFKELFHTLDNYIINTAFPISQTHEAIKEEILGF